MRVSQAVGAELRVARTAAGLSPLDVAQHTTPPVSEDTYRCYELGRRRCPIPRFVDICHVIGVSAPVLLGLALQRVGLGYRESGVRVDLTKMITSHRRYPTMVAFQQWAYRRVQGAPAHVVRVVHLPWVVAEEFAVLCQVSPNEMLQYVRDMAPDSTQDAHVTSSPHSDLWSTIT